MTALRRIILSARRPWASTAGLGGGQLACNSDGCAALGRRLQQTTRRSEM